METSLLSLLAACLAFVGTHFLLSHPLRRPIVARIGEGPFLGLYSLVALATFAWIVLAFRAVPAPDLPGSGELGWAAATLLTLVALVLFLGSLSGNPAFPDPKHAAQPPTEARGVYAVTRHPMMWGFAIWALSHALLYWSVRTLVVTAAIGFLALVGAHLQDRKKEALLGARWADWEARTHFWPRLGKLLKVGFPLWFKAFALWLLASILHLILAGIPAGILRWIGL
ncbi:MAG: MFS transporter [Sphingomonadales bacterium 12-68-11]|nr:MAG: MFS transporter [Sphingomonadales bacterium 12-68-11]